MSRSSVILDAELVYASVIKHLVLAGRTLQDELSKNTSITFSILTWLDDCIGNTGDKVAAFSKASYMYLHLCNQFNHNRVIAMNKIKCIEDAFSDLHMIDSIDLLFDFMESLRELFDNDDNISPNGSLAPTKVCVDSTLGLFLRSLLARWDCLPFDNIGILYSNMTVFMDNYNSTIDNNNDFEAIVVPQVDVAMTAEMFRMIHNSTNDPGLYLVESFNAMELGDVATAESLLHNFFDFNGYDILVSSSTSSTTQTSEFSDVSLSETLKLFQSLHDPIFTNTRHQQAMLHLASMWTTDKNYSVALSAVEEAMKIAHQRGDHISVVKALLLLHEVVIGTKGSEMNLTSNVSAEEVLCRCIKRCAELNARSLASQAVLLLVKLRVKLPLKVNGNEIENISGISDAVHGMYNSSMYSAKNLWSLLESAKLGECGIMSQILAHGTIDTIGMGILPTAPIGPNIKESKDLDVPLNVSENVIFCIQAGIIAIDFYTRLYLPSMALLECKRLLRQYESQSTEYDVALIHSKMAKSLLHIELQKYGKSIFNYDIKERDTIIQTCNRCIELLNQLTVSGGASNTKKSTITAIVINNSILYINIYKSMYNMEWERAYRLVKRLLTSVTSNSVEYAESTLLMAVVLERVNYKESLLMLNQFEIKYGNNLDMMQYLLECHVLRLAIMIHNSNDNMKGTVGKNYIQILNNIIIASKFACYPSVEAMANIALNTVENING